MRRALQCLAAAVLLGFVVAALLKRSAVDRPAGAAPGSADRERIRTFWERTNRANALRLAGSFEEAAAAYRSALALDPAHEDSLYYLAISLKERGEYAEAVKTLERLTAVNPASNRAWSEMGATLGLRAPGWEGDPERARAAFLRGLEINREEAGPFLRLGMLERDQGRSRQALEQFSVAAGFGSPEGNFQMGYTLFLETRYREAEPYFRRVLDTYQRERKIVARGVLSEGDVLPAPGKPLTALDKAGLKAMLFLYWTARRTGAQPEIRLQPLAGRPGLRVRGTIGSDTPTAGPLRFVYRWRRPAALYSGQEDRTERAGLKSLRGLGYSALFFDYDRDGQPDLLVTVHAPYESVVRCLLDPAFRTDRDTPRLFRNQGDGTFEEVTARVGLNRCYGTMQVAAQDVDGDGWTDLLLVNGSLDSHRLEPSVVLRNHAGREFREWLYLPSFEDPGNYVAITPDGALAERRPPDPKPQS
jgi:tetratricopeptide (TPR) repeat protein